MYKFDLFEPQSDLNAALDALTEKFAPLYTESWIKEKAPKKGNPPFDMNVNVFANMWLSKALRIVLAYDDNRKPCGYLMGMTFRPMAYRATVFQVEDWYDGGDEKIKDGLFDYLYTMLKFIGADELWIMHGRGEQPIYSDAWSLVGTTITDCYKKL